MYLIQSEFWPNLNGMKDFLWDIFHVLDSYQIKTWPQYLNDGAVNITQVQYINEKSHMSKIDY